MTKRVRFGLKYLVVLATMLAWWSALTASATVGWALLLAIAYLAPLVVWRIVTWWGRPIDEASR